MCEFLTAWGSAPQPLCGSRVDCTYLHIQTGTEQLWKNSGGTSILVFSRKRSRVAGKGGEKETIFCTLFRACLILNCVFLDLDR